MSLQRTIGAVLDEAVRVCPRNVALKDETSELTFEELREHVFRTAAAFGAAGINHGDRFAVWAPNSISWVVAALGGQIRGAILVALNTRFKGDEIADIINRAKVKAVFVADSFLGTDYLKMLQEAPIEHECRLVVFGKEPSELGWNEFLRQGADYSPHLLESDISAVRPSDVLDISFTSGTTGEPKGIVMTNEKSIGNAEAWGNGVGLGSSDKYLVATPFFHAFGYRGGWLPCLVKHSCMLPLPKYDLGTVFEIIEREKITVFPGPPTIFEDMLKAPDSVRRDTSSLRISVTGAAVVPSELLHLMREELDIDTVFISYGLTETAGITTITASDDDISVAANSVGKPIEGVSVRIVDKDGSILPTGSHGEVQVKSPYNMVGYLDDEESTKETISDDGWLKTGDIGLLDDEGYLKITGRKKEMYIVGGFNCYPAEIEFAIAKHPAVREVAVIGAPHPRLGETGIAFVVRASGAELEERDLLDWARQKMANYKVPSQVFFVDELPRNALGKVQKQELALNLPDAAVAASGE